MKYRDLVEYNKGELGRPLSFFFRNHKPVNIFHQIDGDSHYFILEYIGNLIGYFWAVEITNKILQIKNSVIYDNWQNKGIGTEAHISLVMHSGYKFIHDTQLTDTAEHIWKNKLPSVGLVKNIYDKELDKTYSLSQIGQITTDGKIILDPSQDTSDPMIDYAASSQRFFWITESVHKSPNALLLESHLNYYNLGEAYFSIDQRMYHIANRSPKIIKENIGF